MAGYNSDSSDSWSIRSTDSVDTPRELKFLCTYDGETKIVAVDSNITFSSMIEELSTRCANGSPISFKFQLPSKDNKPVDTLISVTSDKDLKLMMQEYVRHYHGFNSQPNEEYMKLVLSPPNQAAGSKSFLSNMLSSITKAVLPGPDIELVNNTNVRLEFLERPRHLPEQLMETVEPNKTKETYKKNFQHRFKQTNVPTSMVIRGGKTDVFYTSQDFSEYKKFVFEMDKDKNLVVTKS